ncbi:MAG: hypothetical protein D6706_11870 [Chloroflexi bacterium]|nr:MAG: hypothetical protein D6706_11870 [Chloroflexota bacterium]
MINALRDTIRHLNVVRQLPDYFDEEERRLVVQSLVIGVVVWGMVFALKTAVHFVFETVLHWLEESPSPLLVFLPLLAGALIVAAIVQYRPVWVYFRDKNGRLHELNAVEGDGLERAISLYFASEPSLESTLTGQEGVEARWQLPTFTLAIRKFLATLATLGSGGSGGLEASVMLIGESLAAGLFKPRSLVQKIDGQLGLVGRLWRWWQAKDPDDLQTAQLSGIAAAVSVLLGAPFAAAFFAAEVMYRHRPLLEKLIYALISALTAFFLTDLFTSGHTAAFEISQRIVPPSDLRYFGIIILLGVIISLMSIYFGRLRASFEEWFHHRQPDVWQRHLTGAGFTALVALVVHYLIRVLHPETPGFELVLGPGELAVDMAFAGELTIAVALIALFAKMVATLATIGSGGSAGLLIPSLYFGTMVAAVLARLFQYEPQMLIIPGMTATLVAIVNVPLAAILFTVELFGTIYMVPALLILVVVTILAHDNTIYRTQREKGDMRQIVPGVSVQRVQVPPAWDGETLVSLDFRRRFGVTVIGRLEARGDGLSAVRLGVLPTESLRAGDVLLVLGEDEKLNVLAQAVWASTWGETAVSPDEG